MNVINTNTGSGSGNGGKWVMPPELRVRNLIIPDKTGTTPVKWEKNLPDEIINPLTYPSGSISVFLSWSNIGDGLGTPIFYASGASDGFAVTLPMCQVSYNGYEYNSSVTSSRIRVLVTMGTRTIMEEKLCKITLSFYNSSGSAKAVGFSIALQESDLKKD